MHRAPRGLMGGFGIGCVVAVAVAALAGCLGPKAADVGYAVHAPFGSPTFDDQTGGIGGIVTDAEMVSLPGAGVALTETTVLTLTDDGGRFAFSHLRPGTYTLTVSLAGYAPHETVVKVTAGVATTLAVSLEARPDTRPHVDLQLQRGVFGCGSSVRVPVVTLPLPVN